MRTLARLFVMWLLAVALPLQGAAATLMHCQTGHTHPLGEHMVEPAHAEHHHDAASADDEDRERPAVNGGSDAGHTAHHHAGGKSSCNACASCCSAAALPSTPLVLESEVVAQPVLAVPRLPVVAFLTSGPERPPRTILS